MSTLLASRRRPSTMLSLGLVALTAALAAALWAGFGLRRGRGAPTTNAPAVAEDEVARLRDEMKQLRRQMQVMAQQGPGAARAPSAPASASNDLTASAGVVPLSPQETELRDRQHFAAIERKLAAEPVDVAWAPATERLIGETLARPIFAGSKLLSSACHSTLCRFEVSHASEADRRHFGSALPNRLPALPSGSMRRAEGDDARTIVYVAREGHQIPRDGSE